MMLWFGICITDFWIPQNNRNRPCRSGARTRPWSAKGNQDSSSLERQAKKGVNLAICQRSLWDTGGWTPGKQVPFRCSVFILLVQNAGNFREWSTITINNHPSNPQQPIHSLLSKKTYWCLVISHYNWTCFNGSLPVTYFHCRQWVSVSYFHNIIIKLTVCYWKWPFIVSFPIKNAD